MKKKEWRNSCLQQNKHINTNAPQCAITEAGGDSCPPLITAMRIFPFTLFLHSHNFLRCLTLDLDFFFILCWISTQTVKMINTLKSGLLDWQLQTAAYKLETGESFAKLSKILL